MDKVTSKRKRVSSPSPTPKRVSLGEITNATWNCVVARNLDASESPTPDEITRLKTAAFEPILLFIRRERKELGNSTGMQLLNRLRNLEDEVRNLKDEARELRKELREDKLPLRVATLNEWSGETPADPTLSHSRNILAHGGDVLTDIWVIESYAGNPCAGPWKRAFEQHYGISFERLQPLIQNTPEKLIKTLNRRANVHHLNGWKTARNKGRRIDVMTIAGDIIKEWYGGAGDLFMDGSESLRLYQTMDQEYLAGIANM